ncbi:MAG: hypothetical protein JW803_04445 [Endomicrobiales bacterium]|nr:hypothetical protein [Endomicrobiales bacterium]
MKYITNLILFATVSLVFISNAHSAGTSAFNFLKIDPSAYNMSMAGTFALKDPQNASNNPAVLPFVKNREIIVEQLLHVSDINYSSVKYVHPLGRLSAVHVGVGYLGSGSMVKTVSAVNDDGYVEEGSFSHTDMLVSVGYGTKLSYDFMYGFTVKALQETIDGKADAGFAASLCGLYSPWDTGYVFTFGVVDAGPQVKGYNMPTGGFVGMGRSPAPNLYWGLDYITYVDQVSYVRFGIDYEVTDIFHFRIGYRHPFKDNELGKFPYVNLTGGIGVKINDVSFDYGWVPYGDLGQSHRIALSYKFDEPQKKNKKK